VRLPAYIKRDPKVLAKRKPETLKALKNTNSFKRRTLCVAVVVVRSCNRLTTMMTRKQLPVEASREAEEIRRRNAELERAVAEAAAREERLRRELEAALARLAVAEEAEERLCVQLGELEAEAVTQAVEYREHVRALSERLAFADGVLRNSGIAAGCSSSRG
jgi:hypothetical protein